MRGGILGSARLRMAVEEHGAGRQLARFRVWPRLSRGFVALAAVATVPAAVLGDWDDPRGAALLGALALGLAVRAAFELAAACAVLLRGIGRQEALAEYDLVTTLARQAAKRARF